MKRILSLTLCMFGICGIARANAESNPSNELVSILSNSGYHTNPPTPAGVSLTANSLDCTRIFFGPLGQSADCVVRDSRIQGALKISGDHANEMITALLQLGAKGSLPSPETQEVTVKSLSCYFDALPHPRQRERPTWNCIFNQ
jgi:hypothetical protein